MKICYPLSAELVPVGLLSASWLGMKSETFDDLRNTVDTKTTSDNTRYLPQGTAPNRQLSEE